MNDIFSSNKDPKDLQGMFTQHIDFNEVSTPVSLDPLPKHLQNVEDCHNYFRIWNQHYDRCEKEINNQHTKTLNLIHSLSQFFFFLLKYCKQEQENETKSNSLTNSWKGRDIKSRINKKIENVNSRSILKLWTGCWRIFHILWVTNIIPSELIEAKLMAKYFCNATENEYNILIQALLGDPKFPKFFNPKDKDVLILADIAEKLY